ncbi:MAG TPA: EAL domain-containing protein, partial [Solirubrobacteraceae bacterium]|nr:EAL domain-containing protein [Solirubrobacteraceae bacterium]
DNDAAIVRTTIDLARNLGLDVVAEGVESETILRNLSDLSCDIAQGFYLSRPLPAAELDGWLAARADREPGSEGGTPGYDRSAAPDRHPRTRR